METQEAKAELTTVSEGMALPAVGTSNAMGIFLDAALFDQAQRAAVALSKSETVPERYRGKPADCLIAIDLAHCWQMHPIMVMRKVYVIKGQPGIEAQLTVALVNRSGKYDGEIEYEIEGARATDKDSRVRAYAKRARDGKTVYGPWIDWALVRGEGWLDKGGSKWKTMPEQMFHYRAASWFANRHCPEVTLGMPTTDELHEMKRADVVSIEDAGAKAQDRAAALKDRLNGAAPPESDPEADTVERPIIPPEPEGATPDPSPEDNAAEDARLEALSMLHEILAAKGVSQRDETAFLQLMAKANSLKSLTKEQAEECIVKLEDFATARKLGAWLKQEQARRKNGPPAGTLFKD